MQISSVQNIAFQANRTQQRKDAEKQVVAGGGAIAATAASAKATKSGVSLFTATSSKIKGVTGATQTVAEVTKKTSSLWAKVIKNAKWVKDAVMNWGAKFNNLKFIKPIINSRIFRGCAGALGYAFGLITLVSGLSDIGKVATDAVNKMNND